MVDIAVDYYKKLFDKEVEPSVELSQDFWDTEDKVSEEENRLLTASFFEAEIKSALFSCYAEGAPGPDGLSFIFYHKFWDLIKDDLVALFADFHEGVLDLSSLNFALVTLIPKVWEVIDMKQFRPISLLNCSFKIFLKLLTLSSIVQRIVSPTQSTFVKGRFILESVVVLMSWSIVFIRVENQGLF
jgi:hypothetical protein